MPANKLADYSNPTPRSTAKVSAKFARNAAGKAVRSLPIFTLLLTIKNIADLPEQLQLQANNSRPSGFESLPTGADIRREHIGLPNNVDEQKAWVDEKGAATLIWLKMGKDPKISKYNAASDVLAHALRDVYSYTNNLQIPGIWCQAYIDKLKPLDKLASSRLNALYSFSKDMLEKAEQHSYSESLTINFFTLYEESGKAANNLGRTAAVISNYIDDYKNTAWELRQERIKNTTWYNRWYHRYNEFWRQREGCDIGPGYLDPDF